MSELPQHVPVVDDNNPPQAHWHIPGAPMTLCALLVDDMRAVKQFGAPNGTTVCQTCFSILRVELEV